MSLLERAQQLGIKPYSQMDKSEKIQYHQAIAKKYKAEEEIAASEATLMGTATRIGKKVTGTLGLDKAADTFGSLIARKGATEQERQFIQKPTRGEVAGAVLQTGSLLAPVGTMARLAGGVVGKVAGNVLAGAATGYAVDTGMNLSEGKTGLAAATPGLGTIIGAGLPGGAALAGAAKKGVQKIGAKQAPRIINSLIKPLQKEFSYGKNPGRAVAEEGITANSLEELGTNITRRRQEIGKKLGELAGRIGSTVKINLESSLQFLDNAMEEAAKANNTSVLQRLEKVKKALSENLGLGVDESGAKVVISKGAKKLQDVTYQEALDFKRAIGELTSFTGNPSDDKLVNASLKRAYGTVKGLMDDATDNVYPEYAMQIRKLNERYADLTSAEIATKYRDKINSRLNLIGISPTIAGLGTAAGATIVTGGAAIPSILLGATAAALDKALSSPAFKTRLAKWLAKTKPETVNNILDQVPKLEEVIKNKFNAPGDFLLEKLKKIRSGMSIQDVSKSHLLQEAGKARYSSPAEAMDSPEMIAKWDKINAMKRAAKPTPTSNNLYHTTSAENLESIRKNGLTTGNKARFDGVSSSKKISFGANEEAASYYGKDGDVMIRTKTSYKPTDLEEDLLAGGKGAYTTSKNIPPEMLEVKINGKWQPLKENPLLSEAKKYSTPEEFVKAKSGNQGIYNADYEKMIKQNRFEAKPLSKQEWDFLDAETRGDKVKIYRLSTNNAILPGDNVSVHNVSKFINEDGSLNITGAKMGITQLGGRKNVKLVEQWIPKKDLYQTPAGTQVYAPNGTKSLTDLWKQAQGGVPKKSIGDIAKENVGKVVGEGKKIKQSVLNELADFTEYAAKQRKGIKTEFVLDEIRARKIAQKLGINPDVSNWDLAKKFGKILEKYNYKR